MSATRDPGRDQDASISRVGYLAVARRPLQMLAFLLPLVVAYEICLALVLRSDDGLNVSTVEAHRQLLRGFATFGIEPTGGLYLGGIAIVVVLLIWHLLARDPWRIDLPALGMMVIESLVLTLPLLVLSHLISRFALAAGGAPAFDDLSLAARIAISVGAGLYEELVFRMIMIAVIHTLLVDLCRAPQWLGITVAVAASAITFTVYHDLSGPDGGYSARRIAFFLLAGLYFGIIFSTRGFGIVVGTHALYDVLTVLLGAAATPAD
jgi:hypothetical protein